MFDCLLHSSPRENGLLVFNCSKFYCVVFCLLSAPAAQPLFCLYLPTHTGTDTTTRQSHVATSTHMHGMLTLTTQSLHGLYMDYP